MAIAVVRLILLFTMAAVVTSNPALLSSMSDSACPTWFIPVNDSCVCGSDVHEKVQCNEDTQEVSVLLTYCMTYSSLHNTTVVGACPFFPLENASNGYFLVPSNESELDAKVCSISNRTDQLCGSCVPGFAPGVLSYNHACADCSREAGYQWFVFFVLKFVPVTLFFFTMLIFRVGATSGSLNGFVFFAQVFTTANNLKLFSVLSTTAIGVNTEVFWNYSQVMFTIYAFLNLDFFRLFVGSYCLDSNITTVQAIAVDYIIPLYVIFLTGMTYLVVELHDRDVKLIVRCWKPFRHCTHRFRRNWKMKDSLIETFATILLLSYSKLASVSIRLLNGAFVYDVNGKKVALYYYYDATIKFFGREHAPFAILALLVLVTIIVILPLILTLYQFKPFQWCLEHCRLCTPRVQNGLSAFVDSYQGCYKEKYRFFAGLYFILRIIMAAADIDDTFSSRYSRHFLILLLIGMSLAFALLQPYKKKKHNVIDTFHFVILAAIYFLLLNEVFLTFLSRKSPFIPIVGILMILPLLYFIVLQLYWIFFKKGVLNSCVQKLKRRPMHGGKSDNEETRLFRDHHDDSLPDRLVNPESYKATSFLRVLPDHDTA